MGIPNEVTDNPVPWLALIGAVITLAVSFGVHITGDQVTALGGFFAALWIVFGLWGHKVTVPKTPSADAPPAAIQTPKP
jgi:hypothetical protein